MQKLIKKYGDSLVIVFNKEDTRILKIKEGDIISIDDKEIKVIKGESNGTHS